MGPWKMAPETRLDTGRAENPSLEDPNLSLEDVVA